MARKLKGKMSEKLKDSQKQKMQETLKNMDKVREEDNSNLRDLIKQKLAWAMTEKEKGIAQMRKLEKQIYKLEGIILFIQDILSDKKK